MALNGLSWLLAVVVELPCAGSVQMRRLVVGGLAAVVSLLPSCPLFWVFLCVVGWLPNDAGLATAALI